MKNLSKTKELKKIYQDIFKINNELNENKFDYRILKSLKTKIEDNINEEKKVDSNIELFKNNYLQKKTKLMDSIEDYFKQEEAKKEENNKDKETTDIINKEINKENKSEISNENKS